MKEYLDPNRNYELCLSAEDLTKEGMIEIPASGVNKYNYLYSHGIDRAWTEKPTHHYGELLWQREPEIKLATGETLDRLAHLNGYRNRHDGEDDHIYREGLLVFVKNQRETLNDKIASAEVARQEQKLTAWDTQVGGDHYKSLAIQPMQYALANGLDYAQANVVKYVTRHASKNGKQDLLKAIHNIELMIEHYYGE
jgi:hypothetical protein